MKEARQKIIEDYLGACNQFDMECTTRCKFFRGLRFHTSKQLNYWALIVKP